MQKTKLTLRIEGPIIQSAKDYAKHHHTTVSKLVSEYLRSLTIQQNVVNTPVLQELAGVLPTNVSVDEHHRHLENKYGC